MKRYYYTISFLLVLIVLSIIIRRDQLANLAAQQPPKLIQQEFPLAVTQAKAIDWKAGVVSIETEPGAKAQLYVYYCSGAEANSQGLEGVRVADPSGLVNWYWYPDTGCQGSAQATVWASWHNMEQETSVVFEVE